MKHEALRLIGGLVFVLALNATYTAAAACEGNYQPWLPPQAPTIVCTTC